MTIYYKFDDGSGTTPQDSSGNGRHATAAGTAVTWLSGSSCKVEGCLGFSSTRTGSVAPQTAVPLGSVLMSLTAGTMAAWVNPHGTAPNHPSNFAGLPVVIGDNAQYNGIHRGTIAGADDAFRFYHWDSNADFILVPYTVNEWVHLAWVHGGTTMTVYKNGLVASTIGASCANPCTVGSTGGAANMVIGFAGSVTIDAEIDEVRTYTRALTATDVMALVQFGIAAQGNRWRMMRLKRAQPWSVAQGFPWRMLPGQASVWPWAGKGWR